MSLEKCFVVYFPLKSKTVCTVKTAKLATGIAGIILAGYDFQSLIFYEATVDKDGCVFRLTHEDILLFVDSVLYSFLPLMLMFITNFAIIIKFVEAKWKGNQSNSTESTNQALGKATTRGTAMVVIVSVTFLILTAPTAVDDTLDKWYSLGPLYRVFKNITQYLNHSINGLLCCIVGSKFRGELLNIFCRKKRVPDITVSHSVNTNISMEIGTKIELVCDFV